MYTHAQLKSLTDFAIGVQRAADYGDVADLAYASVTSLVPGDVTRLSLSTLCYPTQREHLPMQRSARETATPRFNPYGHEDPVYLARLRRIVDGATQVSHLQSTRAFERSRFYNEVWRTEGIERSAAYYNPGRHALTLLVNRASPRDFADAEIGLLEMIGRHVETAVEVLSARNNGKLPVRGTLEPVQRFSWAVCAKDTGKILRCDDDTRRLLRACDGERSGHVNPNWMEQSRHRLQGHPGDPIRAHANGRDVRAYLAPIRGCPEEFTISFVEDPIPANPGTATPGSADRLGKLGLTPREQEVTRWLAEGKTNPEIAIILNISPLTAKKHVEKILAKLGVETRTAAAARILETQPT